MIKIIRLVIITLTATTFAASSNTLYVNFSGYHTPDDTLKTFNALYVREGKVVATGDAKPLIKRYPNAPLIDLAGKSLLPGLIDGHGHVASLGLNLQRVTLRGAKSEQASVNTVSAFAHHNPTLAWIQGRGWNQVIWPSKTFPTKQSLDEKIAHRPVWLRRIDGHAGWANSKALSLAGINRDTIVPSGGEILKDKFGEPTGVLIDNAMELIERHIPPTSPQELQDAIVQASHHLLKLGITSVHDAGIDTENYQTYLSLAAKKKLPVRVYGMISAAAPGYQAMLDKGPVITDDDMLNISSVKISADGALGSRGAAMLAPYSDDNNNSGLLLFPPKTLEALMAGAINKGFQTNVHAIGDKANHLALNYFEKFNRQPESHRLRHRIEHAQVVAVTDLPRFNTIGVLPSMQPTHATSDMNMAHQRIGHERIKGAYAWRTLLESGVKIVSGSDFPIEYANPFFGLHAATSRQDRDDMPKLGWLSHEAMTLSQALRSFTLDAAYGAHQERVIGSLEPGKWADFIITDIDIFAVKPQRIWQAKVEQTFIAGQQVYLKD